MTIAKLILKLILTFDLMAERFMDKNKTKKGSGASTPDKPKRMVVTHKKVTAQKLYAQEDEQEASGITPKIPTEIVSNPIDPGVNPAKYIKPRTSAVNAPLKTQSSAHTSGTTKLFGAEQTASAYSKTTKE